MTGKLAAAAGLSGLVSPEANDFLKAFLTNLDIFSLWSMILMVFGFSTLFGFTIKKSTAILSAAELVKHFETAP